jgi:hypothetical protein
MPRRRSKTDVSMFPFLSVLCCVIGILILFIVLVLSTRVVVEEEKYKEIEAHQRKQRSGKPDVLAEGIDPVTYRALEGELRRLQELLEERKTKRDELRERLATLEELLQLKKDDVFVPAKVVRAPEFDKPEPVAMVPDQGVKVDLRPHFIEVSLQGYIVHPDKEVYPPLQATSAESAGAGKKISPGLDKILQQINSRRKKEYVVFLIHPNGVEAFFELRGYLSEKYAEVQMGWEPFSREWVMAKMTP